MKKIWLAGLIIAAMVAPSLVFAQVEVGSGAMQLSGKVKWLYAYQSEDEDAVGAGSVAPGLAPTYGPQFYGFDGAGVENFATTNVEIDVNGTLGENVAYAIELQAANSSGAWGSNANDMGWVGVRQAKVMFNEVIPMTTITVGTFNLPVSNYQPRATNDLDLIFLPMLNNPPNAFGNPGLAYAPIGLGWQATGIDVAVKPMDMVVLDLAYFNGNAGGAVNDDIDLEKSWLINLKVMPVEGACIAVGYLTEGWQEDLNAGAAGVDTEQQNAAGWVVSGAYIAEKLELNFDWMTMTAVDYQATKKNAAALTRIEDLTWTGYQLTAGYWITDAIEGLIRYEFIDPNTLNSKKTFLATGWPSKYDALTVWTIGANYRVNENAEASINYLIIQEQGNDIDMNHKVGAVITPKVGNKYQVLANDLLLIQVQVWQ